MSFSYYSKYLKFKKKCCPLCSEGNNCSFRFPNKNDFEPNGKFSHIKFPISEYNFPKDLFDFIHPNNWNEKYDHLPFHSVYSIIKILNEIKFYDCYF